MKRISNNQKATLIRSTNWIGDAVMSLPAIREIRRLFPGDHLSLFAKEWVADIYRDQGLVDEIITFGNHERSLKFIRRIRGFDRAILLQNAFEAGLLAFLSGIPERIGYDTHFRRFLLNTSATPRIKELRRHQVFYYLDLLYQTGLSSIDYLNEDEFKPDISLTPSAESREKARKLLQASVQTDAKTIVGINPGAYYGPAKRWTADRYAALADRLIDETGAVVVIFGSAAEHRIAEEIQGLMNRRPLLMTGQTDLAGLIGLISRCDLFITNDSGPMHLAAALDVKQIAIFGSTDEVATGPYSTRASVIHKHVECSPCLRRTCPIDLRCFTRIEVQEVLDLSLTLLSERAR